MLKIYLFLQKLNRAFLIYEVEYQPVMTFNFATFLYSQFFMKNNFILPMSDGRKQERNYQENEGGGAQ